MLTFHTLEQLHKCKIIIPQAHKKGVLFDIYGQTNYVQEPKCSKKFLNEWLQDLK